MARVREQHARSGKTAAFEQLQQYLTAEGDGAPYAVVARSIGLTEGAVKVAVHRLRRQFRDALIQEIALTVSDPRDVDAEIRYLLAAVSSSTP